MGANEKTCKKCLCKLPAEAFYANAAKCKPCTIAAVKQYRQENLEKVRAYDRFRGGLPHRVQARAEYMQTDAGKKSHARSLAKQRVSNPVKAIARNAVSNAVRDKRLAPWPCEVCGHDKTVGHHADYSNALGVTWLCQKHHTAVHKMARELMRNSAT